LEIDEQEAPNVQEAFGIIFDLIRATCVDSRPNLAKPHHR